MSPIAALWIVLLLVVAVLAGAALARALAAAGPPVFGGAAPEPKRRGPAPEPKRRGRPRIPPKADAVDTAPAALRALLENARAQQAAAAAGRAAAGARRNFFDADLDTALEVAAREVEAPGSFTADQLRRARAALELGRRAPERP